MPLTFPAHQALVLPLKLWRPRAFDGTALCVGAAAPDLAYPLGEWLGRQSHTATGVVVWAVPITYLACRLLRWRSAAGLFAHLPDLGPFRVRSYRVLREGRPLLWITLASALLGSLSHVFIDGFTHTSRWGADWLGLDQPLLDVPLRGEVTTARVLQYTGHTIGSVVGLVVFLVIGRRRLLDRWYGSDAVAAARGVRVTPAQRVAFWAAAVAPPLLAITWIAALGGDPVFGPISALAAGLLIAGALPLWHGIDRADGPGRPGVSGGAPGASASTTSDG